MTIFLLAGIVAVRLSSYIKDSEHGSGVAMLRYKLKLWIYLVLIVSRYHSLIRLQEFFCVTDFECKKRDVCICFGQ